MPRAPKLASFPAIRGALRFYQVCSVITGTMLLLLCAEMIVKYALGYELFLGGSGGFLWFAPVVEGPDGHESTGDGFNLSLGILVAHGWFYVVYLFSCFRVWSLMRWPFWRLAAARRSAASSRSSRSSSRSRVAARGQSLPARAARTPSCTRGAPSTRP